jgi:hypothetical protein
MSPPIRDGSGNSIGSIRLGDGSEIAEVRTGAGDVLFSGLPASAIIQYDASAESFADGDVVGTITDQINGNDLTGSATYRAGVQNGKAVYRHSGGSDGFDGSVQTLSQPLTIIAVIASAAQVQGTNNQDREMIATNDVGGGQGGEQALYWEGNSNHNWRLRANKTGQQFGNISGTVEPSPLLLTGILDGTNAELREDGATVGTGDSGSVDWGTTLTIGRRNNGIDNTLNGDLGEVIFYDKNLKSTGNLSSEEQRIATKWGITLA